ncbi:OmpA family protein [Neolewinella persica]|uniref:OmpA family protein n=1 Tax=Neolewinella persica TaxID=70998 RepID=UPI00035E5B3B|nr:OmpA family protein [Neolewinella persica]
MRFVFTLAAALLLALPFTAQTENLVLNAGFEATEVAKSELSDQQPIATATSWTSANAMPASLFTSDGKNINDSYGSDWPFAAHDGDHVAGIEIYGNQREYVQGTLAQPLEVGKAYSFSFYVHYHCSGANGIGIAFLPSAVQTDDNGLLSLIPVTYQKDLTRYEKGKWEMISGTFVARKPYQSFIIGNFFSDDDTKVQADAFDHFYAYIDDVSVRPSNGSTEGETSADAAAWEGNVEKMAGKELSVKVPLMEKRSLGELTFSSGSSQLNAASRQLLDDLIAQMENTPAALISIAGYASTDGPATRNQALSEDRAFRVFDYLMGKGFAPERFIVKGNGEAAEPGPEQRKVLISLGAE